VGYRNGGFVIKRRFPRFSVSGVRGKVSFVERAEIINVSVGGVALKTDRRLEIGREHKLIVEGGNFRIELTAIIVWSKPTAVRRIGESVLEYTAGLRFVEVPSPWTQKLVGFFKRKKKGDIRFSIKARDLVLLDVDDPCEVKLISRSGMLIRTERPFEVESVYLMEIIPSEQVPIRLNGRIASQMKSTQGHVTHHDLGVEFIDMSEDDRRRLDVFLDSISSG
jgi:c-di-GMP-binding flagellar brake protein YcgR